MSDNRESSKRIAKNTLLLYIRMFFTMFIGLFTSRVILNTLGIDDYGIHNVVGGVVTMFSIFTSSLSAAISRFLTYELGKGNLERLKTIFSTSVNVLLLLSLCVVALAEISGVWFLNEKLNIPAGRLEAANWVLQCSIVTFILGLISVPYNAAIIAHERMKAFAYISVLEVTLKLIIAYLLYASPFDKLKTYAVLLVLVAIIVRIVYGLYCNRHFAESRYQMVYDRKLLNEMTSFAGWNLMGSGAYLFNTQGVNIITNMFFGVAVNAARGIATQVDGVVKQFVTNFMTAINPQITKSYAVGDKEYMFTLVCRSSKYSYFLMLFFAIPFMYETEIILLIWLKNVPDYAALFLRLTMLGSLFDILGNSTANAAWATGHVKRYYVIVGGVGCLVFPFSCLLFALGMPAYTSYIVFIIVYIALIFVKLYVIKGLLDFPVRKYYNEVLARIIPVSLLSLVVPGLLFCNISSSLLRMICVTLLGAISNVFIIYQVGLEQGEKGLIKARLRGLIKKRVNN